MTDKEAFNEFARGVALTIGAVGALFLIVAIFGTVDPQPVAEPTPSKGIFKVIDHYKDCDVVQYQYGMLAEYRYFLDCPK
jgi:hypothetical protein